MREAVFVHKFDPFAIGLFPRELLRAAGKSAADVYQHWLPLVRDSDTDWNVCARCLVAMKPYLEKVRQVQSMIFDLGAVAIEQIDVESSRNISSDETNTTTTEEKVTEFIYQKAEASAKERGWPPEMVRMYIDYLKANLPAEIRKQREAKKASTY